MIFAKKLITWYLQNKRDLPWRNTKNPYKIWLSEVILQQTRVNQGMPYYFKFIEKFPTVYDLAEASEETVLKTWQGLGYYSRARNLHESAKMVVNLYNGEFPKTHKELLTLKGVGDYTASAIASICYNSPNAVVDGNVYRVLARYFNISIPINTPKGFKYFKQTAQELIDTENPGTFNQALMELGATVCTPKKMQCESCPLVDSCLAKKNDNIYELPVKEKKIKITKKYFNYIVLNAEAKTLVEKREKGIWMNMYQFPLIETSEDINIEAFKSHQLLKNVTEQPYLFNKDWIIHKLSHQHLHVKFWIVNLEQSVNKMISWKEVSQLPVPKLIENFISEFRIK